MDDLINISVIEKTINPNKKLIPKGAYCYSVTEGKKEITQISNGVKKIKLNKPYLMPKYKLCPFWRINKKINKEENGYCSYMGKGDWERDGTLLLFDQVKECGINDED